MREAGQRRGDVWWDVDLRLSTICRAHCWVRPDEREGISGRPGVRLGSDSVCKMSSARFPREVANEHALTRRYACSHNCHWEEGGTGHVHAHVRGLL